MGNEKRRANPCLLRVTPYVNHRSSRCIQSQFLVHCSIVLRCFGHLTDHVRVEVEKIDMVNMFHKDLMPPRGEAMATMDY